jgi:RND family efflux transporter MFP subunit
MHKFFPLALLAFLGLTACKQPAPPEVQVIRPAQVWTVSAQSNAAQQRFSGELRARFEADLAFRVGGKVVERAVELGQAVSAGQVLVRLDAADLNLGVSSAQASLAGAEADKLNAQQELTRVQGLYEQKFLGKSALDAAVATRNAAAARADALRAQSKQSGNQAQYSALLASKPGVITAVNVELGQVVAAGAPVLRIAYAGEHEVHLRVGEASAPLFAQALQQQQALSVSFWSRPGKPTEGRVREIAPVTDTTRSVLVKISLPQVPDDLPLGATAEVTLQSAPLAGEVWLPATALFQDAEKPAVWLLGADHSVQLQAVSVLRYTHDGVLVRGLMPGEQVIAAGVHTLNAGQIVRPIPFDGHSDVHVDTKKATQVSQ